MDKREAMPLTAHASTSPGRRATAVECHPMPSEIVVAAMAHDMRNLLSGVTLNLQVLEACELSRDERRAALRDMREGLHRLVGFASELMEWAARSAAPDAEEPVRVADVVANCLRLAGLFVPDHRCSFDVELAAECVVHGRRRDIEIAIVNVLVNAVEANGRTGSVRVAVDRRDRWAVVRVRDQGPGVGADARAKLFKPFFTTKGAHGSGIGLAATRSIARAAGGDARLTCAGPGAEFEIELPLAE